MDDDVGDFESVVSRLHSAGQQPVGHALEQRVLARANRSRRAWLHSTKLKVAAALAGGFMIGSVGLASAGALPGPAQDVARAALGALGVDVPPGHDRYNGPECGNVTTHGEYVDAHPDDPAAGKSPCGKPNKAVNHAHPKGSGSGSTPGDARRHGRPPWAGQGKGKDKGTDKATGDDQEDSPTTDVPSVAPTNSVEPTTTATATEVPTTTTLAEEPAVTTNTTGDSEASTTVESTTSTSTND
jgi:hypothetical protein